MNAVTTNENKVLEVLQPEDPKSDREAYKDHAVVLREQGHLEAALTMFNAIIAWDERNDNFRGKMDVLGHKKNALVLLSEKESDPDKKREYLTQAIESIREAITIGENTPTIPDGPVATQKVNLASLTYRLGLLLEPKQRGANLRKAVEIVDEALRALPGSEAHKSWALGIKANILHDLGQDARALETLSLAQQKLFDGYKAEIMGGDQGEMKLKVWLTGIYLTYSRIHADNDQLLLAEFYAQAIVNYPDREGILKNRKEEAQKILDSLVK